MKTLAAKLLISVLSLVALIGCNQDPYNSAVKPGQRIVTENTPNGQEIPRVYSVEGPSRIECTESQLCEAEFVGHVPAPGEVIFKVSGLPKGAKFDLSNGKFSFTPGYDFVDVGAHPDQTEADFDFVITLMSTLDNSSATTWPVSGKVKNKLQALDLIANGSMDANEGSVFEKTLEITSADFPQGPFTLNKVSGPDSVEIIPVSGNPKQFRLRYTPDHTVVNFNDTYSNTKNVVISLNLGSPLGKELKKDFTVVVRDVRKEALITTPEKVTLGTDNTMFAIRAEDLNGEESPSITVHGNVPFGKISTVEMPETASPGSNPSKILVVKWDQLSPMSSGTTTPVNYEVCVRKTSTGSGQSLCTQRKVMVTLKRGARTSPMLTGSDSKEIMQGYFEDGTFFVLQGGN